MPIHASEVVVPYTTPSSQSGCKNEVGSYHDIRFFFLFLFPANTFYIAEIGLN